RSTSSTPSSVTTSSPATPSSSLTWRSLSSPSAPLSLLFSTAALASASTAKLRHDVVSRHPELLFDAEISLLPPLLRPFSSPPPHSPPDPPPPPPSSLPSPTRRSLSSPYAPPSPLFSFVVLTSGSPASTAKLSSLSQHSSLSDASPSYGASPSLRCVSGWFLLVLLQGESER
ncbi:unnamed protein product, partial [Brassica oleracea]